jgi:hypothetical protein
MCFNMVCVVCRISGGDGLTHSRRQRLLYQPLPAQGWRLGPLLRQQERLNLSETVYDQHSNNVWVNAAIAETKRVQGPQ